MEAAISRGVHFKQATVSALSLDENNDCHGVELEGCERLEAKHIIVATGAWTPWFLAETAPLNKDVQVGNRIVTVGPIQCQATFDASETEKLKHTPVIFNAQHHTEGMHHSQEWGL